MSARAWAAARAEHAAAIDALAASVAGMSAERWTRGRRPGKWSPAAVVLHVTRAYEVGRAAASGGPAMRPLFTPWKAWVGRTLLLPAILAMDRFPAGAEAPGEVVPDVAEAERATVDDAIARLRRAASETIDALERAEADRPALRVRHAYFGALRPRRALRLLGAHTRHHARRLATELAR